MKEYPADEALFSRSYGPSKTSARSYAPSEGLLPARSVATWSGIIFGLFGLNPVTESAKALLVIVQLFFSYSIQYSSSTLLALQFWLYAFGYASVGIAKTFKIV